MWHEARKHEKKLRVLIVDYRRRAERRREFYEKFKSDPAQFMQVHGRPCKIHMDPQIAQAAESCLMPWQGHEDNMIDRFDARAHLDRLPESSSSANGESGNSVSAGEEPGLNYERYRILIQNDLAGVSEDKFLHQIYIEEQFGTPTVTLPHGMGKGADANKAKMPKAAIGYVYEDSTPAPSAIIPSKATPGAVNDDDEESDEDVDFDLLVNVKDLNLAQQAELNNGGVKYGLQAGEFMNNLNADLEEKEQMRLAKIQEEEKQTMSGRKARRERRAYKDRIILRKGYVSPPSYAARANSSSEDKRRSTSRSESRSKSRSNSPEKITFITSFGGNESDSEKKRDQVAKDSSLGIFGPSLPPGGLPTTSKWRKSPTPIKKSPSRRRMRTRSRSRSRSRSDYKSSNHNSSTSRHRRRTSSSSSRSSSKAKRTSSRRKRSRSTSRRRHRKSRTRSKSRSRSRERRTSRRRRSKDRSRSRSRSSYSRTRSRNSHRSRSHQRSKERHRSGSSRYGRTKNTSRSRSRSSRRKSSGSGSKTKSSSSSSTSSSSSSSSPPRSSRTSSSLGKKSYNETSTTASSSKQNNSDKPRLPSPPVKCYYDRAKAAHKKENSGKSSSESESSSSSDSDTYTKKSDSIQSEKYIMHKLDSGHHSKSLKSSVNAPSKGSSGGSSSMKLTPQERLKRRMQIALNKQLKADKEAEKSRIEKKVQERMEREESLRELSIKYRRSSKLELDGNKEREKRHKKVQVSSSGSDSSDGGGWSGSESN